MPALISHGLKDGHNVHSGDGLGDGVEGYSGDGKGDGRGIGDSYGGGWGNGMVRYGMFTTAYSGNGRGGIYSHLMRDHKCKR